ncbi:hypothetical protein [Paraburkholderia unamae]|uniref:hypothetical protein n=1 Tax=Paraburkholderia unamae TaxID=219649 RepID=UPI0011BE7260|nr:hypothetical protein [Paraburkholderia unamae]
MDEAHGHRVSSGEKSIPSALLDGIEVPVVDARERDASRADLQTLTNQRATLAAKQAELATAKARLRELGKHRGEVNVSPLPVIENGHEDLPGRSEIFFSLRERMRAVRRHIPTPSAAVSEQRIGATINVIASTGC